MGRRRRPGLWVAGLGLTVLSGLAAAAMVDAAGEWVPVLAVARGVHLGQPLTAADLVVARVPPDPALRPVPAAELPQVVGKVAAVELPAGSLLAAAAVAATLTPARGEQLVGMALRPGQWPARGLSPGDRVLVVPTPAGSDAGGPTAGADAAPVAAVPARVAEVGPSGVDGSVTVDLTVAERWGVELAGWAATGRVSLLLMPAGG